MRAKDQAGTLELVIQIGTETAVVTVSLQSGGWSTMLQQHGEERLGLEGEPTSFTVSATPVAATPAAPTSTHPAEAVIHAIYRPGVEPITRARASSSIAPSPVRVEPDADADAE